MASVDIVARLKLAGEEFTRDFKGRMDGIEREARSASSRVNATFGGLKTAVGGLVATIGVGAIAAAAKNGLEYAASLGEVSQQLGVTTRDLQVYRYAATQVGIEQVQMDDGLKKLTQSIGKAATGAAQQGKIFKALGIDVRDANGNVKTAGMVIPELAAALEKVTSPAQRAAVEVALFGKNGQILDTLLAGGRKAVEELTGAAERLGIVLTNEQIQNADKTADKLADIKTVLEARIAGVVSENADAILDLANAFMTVAGWAVKAGGAMVDFGKVARIKFESSVANDPHWAGPERRRYARDFVVGQAASQAMAIARGTGFAVIGGGRAPERAPPPPRDGIDLADFNAGGGGKPKKAGKSDAERDAERAAKEEKRLADSIEKTIGQQRTQIRLGEMRLAATRDNNKELERQADREEAIADIHEQYPDLIGRQDAAAKAYLATLERQKLELVAQVHATEDIAEVDRRAKEDAREWEQRREQSERYVEEILREQEDRQRDQISELADFYRDAFTGGTGSIWESFKEQGLDIIAQLAAQWTMALLSGQQASMPGILAQLGSGQQGGGILGALMSGYGGTGGGIPSTALQRMGANGATPAEIAELTGGSGGSGGALAGAAMQAGSAMPAIGAAIAVQQALGKALGFNSTATLFGGLLGGGLYEMVKKKPFGTAVLTSATGDARLDANKGSAREAAGSAADAVQQGLARIADALGGELGGFSTSIGTYKGRYRVSGSGYAGRLDFKGESASGLQDFGEDAEAAVRAAIADALSDGAIQGISDASKRIIAAGEKDIEAAISKAVLIEGIPKALKAMIDPLGSALDEFDARWKKTTAALKEGSASAEDMARAQQLYNLELEELKATTPGAAQGLKDFLASLGLGPASPYSLRDQGAKAEAALKPFLDKIGAGERIDQDKYQQAAQQFLEIERQLYGSTGKFFQSMDVIQAATGKAISDIDKAVPIRTAADPFIEKTASNTMATAELLGQVSQQTQTQIELLQSINSRLGGSGGGFIGGGRGFAVARG